MSETFGKNSPLPSFDPVCRVCESGDHTTAEHYGMEKTNETGQMLFEKPGGGNSKEKTPISQVFKERNFNSDK